jgi:hypothetical protein
MTTIASTKRCRMKAGIGWLATQMPERQAPLRRENHTIIDARLRR